MSTFLMLKNNEIILNQKKSFYHILLFIENLNVVWWILIIFCLDQSMGRTCVPLTWNNFIGLLNWTINLNLIKSYALEDFTLNSCLKRWYFYFSFFQKFKFLKLTILLAALFKIVRIKFNDLYFCSFIFCIPTEIFF